MALGATRQHETKTYLKVGAAHGRDPRAVRDQ